MESLSRVVWSEGMHLAQHHFQMQSRYFEGLTHFSLASLFFKPYGLASCDLDAEALRNGTVSVNAARGIMPDGAVFNFPEDPAPEPLEISELFSPTHDSHMVLLVIPPQRPGKANCVLEPDAPGDVRYLTSMQSLVDETTGEDERAVAVARKNFRLVLDVEPPEDAVALPIARVRRDGAGHFIYDPDYIPPCVRIEASARLMDMLARLGDMLDSRAEAMAAERGQVSVAEYASREIAGFWLAHAIHSALAPLRYHLQTRGTHPEQLFLELSRLAGALCTFSLSSHPRDLPLYDHDNLDRCFNALDRHIRAHLDLVLPTNSVTVPLQQTDGYLYTGKITDRRCFEPSTHWFLGVRSSASAAELTSRVPKLVKLCSAKHIARLVKEAYPGMALEHVATPPSELPARIGTHYFTVKKSDPCWKSVVDTGEVGAYAPAAIPDAQLELVIVLEG